METQIISSEIYTKVTQDKFLPIVFKKGSEGEIDKPIYLKTVLHFDLSAIDTYNQEYKRLVKRLYGIDIIKKPELGNRPEWVDEETDTYITHESRLTFESFTKSSSEKDKNYKFTLMISNISNKILEYKTLESKEHLEEASKIFGYSKTEDFISKFYEIEKSFQDGTLEIISYPRSFESVPTLS